MRLKDTCPLLALAVVSGIVYTLAGPVMGAAGQERNPSVQDAAGSGETQVAADPNAASEQEMDTGSGADKHGAEAGFLQEEDAGTTAEGTESSGGQEADGDRDAAGSGAADAGDALASSDAPEDGQDEQPAEPDELEGFHFGQVSEDYFDDVLFIGDSRTVGLYEYCEPLSQRADFFAKISLTVNSALDQSFIKTDDGKKNAEELLRDGRQYGKIYIMLGLNEIGGGTDESFASDYRYMIERIRNSQPRAQIVIQSILHVTKHKSNSDRVFNNERINGRNAAIATLADADRGIWYLDINEAFDDEEGNLRADHSFDEIHLKAASYVLWYDYLAAHGLVSVSSGEDPDTIQGSGADGLQRRTLQMVATTGDR